MNVDRSNLSEIRASARYATWIAPLTITALIISRRPDAMFCPQFWAEDGAVWYADAYNKGATALLLPHNGYFQMLPRLIAMLAQYVPFSLGPLLFNSVALLIQISCALFVISSRASTLGKYRVRLMIAFLYLAIPNSNEIHGNLTNAQWHLAFLSLLVILAKPPTTNMAQLFDLVVIGLTGFTGPFVIFLCPIAALLYMKERAGRYRSVLIYCVGCGLVQVGTLLITWSPVRMEAVRGASPTLLLEILVRQVFGAALLGRRTLGGLSSNSFWALPVALLAALSVGIHFCAWLCGPFRWKMLFAFSTRIFVASLAYPMVPSPQWHTLASAGGIRYWFFPILAFLMGLVCMVEAPNHFVRSVARILLTISLVGVVQDWGHPRFTDQHFQEYVQAFSQVSVSTPFAIPLNPEGWSMKLIKK